MYFIGNPIRNFFYELGQIVLFALLLFKSSLKRPIVTYVALQQLHHLGVKSLGVVSLTALFIGLAFSVQILNEFVKFGAGELIGGVVSLAVWRELSPLMSATVVAARVGSALAAEISSLKISEQLLAYKALSKNIDQWILLPRILAVFIMLPLLVVWANIVGVLAGYLMVYLSPFVNASAYFDSIQQLASSWDFVGSMIKAIIFALMIGVLGCFYGCQAEGGTEGVGKATRKMVVVALLSIFVMNYLLSLVLF